MSTTMPETVPLTIPVTDLASAAAPSGTRFHLSLNVTSIPQMASFLQLVLGIAPAKQRPDYAKFELSSPPLVLSLEQNPPLEAGALNHLGFRFCSHADLVNAQNRIEAAGISVRREEGVECCYAKQTKFWVHDPDHRLWEFYVLEGDLAQRGEGQTLEQMVGEVTACEMAAAMSGPVVTEHRMGAAFSLTSTPSDLIRLRGSFNVPVNSDEMDRMLCECFENLKPGGQIELHMLTSELPLDGPIELPGAAAYVKHVPVRQDLMQKLDRAGFVDVRLVTFRSAACFQLEGKPLRETKIVACRPLAVEDSGQVVLVYRGPFAEIRDDDGNVWRRGEPAGCSARRWEEMKRAGHEEAFTVMPQVLECSPCTN